MTEHRAFLFDVEGNGLEATKLWCLSYLDLNVRPWTIKTITDTRRMFQFFQQENITLYGHNIWAWDIPTVERVLDFKLDLNKVKIYDTLGWSWYFFGGRTLHGLGSWGEDFGVPKPKIEDKEWEGPLPGETHEQFIAKMTHRCEEDVKINSRIILACREKGNRIYGKGVDLTNLYEYLSEKQYAYYIKQKNPFTLDLELCEDGLQELETKINISRGKLEEILPDVPVYVKKTPPKNPYKKDGSLSATGKSWFDLLKKEGLPENFAGEVEYIKNYNPPNPNSTDQIKNYLFSLGWEPTEFKDSISKTTGNVTSVPQLRIPDGNGGKTIPDCVKKLAEIHPQLWVLEDMGVLAHRISILEGFLKAQKDGKITADIAGFTNTLRVRHKTLVNLPGVDKAYGELIRGCLATPNPDTEEIFGTDISGLEDGVKMNFIQKYDPQYVIDQQIDGFDPHLDVAIVAKLLTEEESDWYKAYDRYAEDSERGLTPQKADLDLLENSSVLKENWGKEYKRIKNIRKLAKITNFSSVYGVGAAKLSKTLGVSLTKAKKILKAYWSRNHAVITFTERDLEPTVIKLREKTSSGKVFTEIWVKSPANGFYYTAKSERDLFSATCQSAGAYYFDSFVTNLINEYPKLIFQAHDEVVFHAPRGRRESIAKWVDSCMEKVNKDFKLKVPLGVQTLFGDRYSDIH